MQILKFNRKIWPVDLTMPYIVHPHQLNLALTLLKSK